MQTIILPSESKEDKVWVDEMALKLKADGTEGIIRPFYWMHWTDDNFKFDIQEKADLIAKHLRGEKARIIAKGEGLEIANILKSILPEQITLVV
jgi:hypothetical protein